ncbi:MAG: preprotein translocase subunit YajC [Bacteroidales bacterium]|jgi:preprotein translocase subunit YajC|nr:preprotein translocase subunit YajC [Bacteroidales bacterium]MDD4001498.1 preprotein translocase subunit YajC [Bacteroidales bacterium]MDD4528923.1 preprotein translocase subunit YajC [Bacteroidales bacterium]MDD4829372.1 preprotein translocase subunit YajC [Bacteroidales bacterium]
MNLINVLLMAPSSGGASGSGWSSILMLVAIIVIFYFFMIRPQSAKAKKEKQFRETLQKGQKVITISGLHGKVVEVKETTIILEIASNVQVEIEKTAVAIDMSNLNTKK